MNTKHFLFNNLFKKKMISNILLSSLWFQQYGILLLPEAAKLYVVQSRILSVIYYCFPPYSNSNFDMESIKKL